MDEPGWLSYADKIASVVGASAGLISLLISAIQARRGSAQPAGSTRRPATTGLGLPWLGVGLIAVLAGVVSALGVRAGRGGWLLPIVAVAAGTAILIRVVAAARRAPLSQALRTFLNEQLQESDRRGYRYFDFHAPAISRVYVQQRVDATSPERVSGDAGLGVLTMTEIQRRPDKFRSVLVVAGPGMGKSTLVSRITHEQCAWWLRATRLSQARRAPYGPAVPIAMPARLLARGSLRQALREVCGPDRIDLADEINDNPPGEDLDWLIMVDGLDEVLNTHERSDLLHSLAQCLRHAGRHHRFLITTRPLLYAELSELRSCGVAEFVLQSLNGQDLRSLTTKWFTERPGGRSIEESSEQFLSKVESSRLGTLLSVPLLATIALLVWERSPDTDLPSSRAGLYQRYVEHLLQGRRLAQEQRERLQREFEQHSARVERAWAAAVDCIVGEAPSDADGTMLEQLADDFLAGRLVDLETGAQQWLLATERTHDIEGLPGWRGHLRSLLASTGILTDEDGRIVFLHRSIAEFLAAGVRGRAFSQTEWLTQVRLPDTRNVALFTLARSPVADVDALVQELLDNGQEQVIAASDVMADGIDVAMPLQKRVVDALMSLLRDDVTPIAGEALRVLGDLLPYAEVRERLGQFVRDPAADDWARVLVAVALDERAGPQSSWLHELLTGRRLDADVQAWAVRHAFGVDNGAAAAPSTQVSSARVSALAGLAYRRSLKHSNDPVYRVELALLLASDMDAEALDVLREYLTAYHNRPDLSLRAARALLRCDGDDARRTLHELSDDQARPVDLRAIAAIALVEAGEIEMETVLGHLLTTDAGLRRRIGRLLPSIAGPPAAEGIRPDAEPATITAPDVDILPAPERPRIWGGVPPRNPDFTGREDVLLHLRQSLESESAAALIPQVLHGLGGVGKTQIATEYAHRFAYRYDLVWWIPADQRPFVAQSLVSLGHRLGLPEIEDLEQTARMAVQALADSRLRWLLIYDNADEPHDLELMPPTGGHVIVTSRNHLWATVAFMTEVAVFSRPESIDLIRSRAPEITFEDADRLAEKLGDLPVALAQAASWRASTAMPVAEYIDLLDEHARELMSEGGSASYPLTFAASVTLAHERLRNEVPAAAQLLELFAFLGAEPVPLRLLRAGRPQSLSEPLGTTLRDVILRNRTIRELRRFGLVSVDAADQSIQVHRLVQMVLRDVLTADETTRSRANVQQLLVWANPGDPGDARNWPLHAEIGPHLQPAGLIDGDSHEVRQVVLDQIRYRLEIGDFENARRLAAITVPRWRDADMERGLESDSESTLLATGGLADALRSLGDNAEARWLAEFVFDSFRGSSQFGPDHRLTLISALAVATDLRVAGRFQAALELDRDCVDRHRQVAGDGDPFTQQAVGNMAVDLRLLDNFQEAYTFDERLLLFSDQGFGDHDQLTLLRRINLARDLYGLGRYVECVALLEQTLPLYRSSVGAGHPNVVLAARTFAAAWRKAGNYPQAQELAQENYQDTTSRFRADHQHTLAATMTYANSLRVVGHLADARALATETAERYRRSFGSTHPFSLAATVNLAVILRASGDTGEARKLDENAYAALAQALGEDHSYTLCAANNLANDIALTRNPDEDALGLAEQTMARSRRARGDHHPDTLACAVTVAHEVADGGEAERGQALLAQAVDHLVEVLGPNHPETINALLGRRAECDIEPPPT